MPSTAVLERPAPASAPTRPHFRPEIQGLRAVAVLLVAVYHIWFGRVSGGVDVFLLLTGFFITGSLLREIERHGRVRPLGFIARISRRLIPTAAVVLVGILAASYLWLPPSRWAAVLEETVASALYYENWALARNAVDYLVRDQAASPLQHFWSLSIQGQFYLIWLVLLAGLAVAARLMRESPRRLVFAACASVFAVSLTYSVMKTANDQAWAYFDTGARLWEFALGGMLAIVIDRLRPSRTLRLTMGWAGIAALLSCGALLQVSTSFPGYVALWPVGAAALMIVAGTSGHRLGADRLLTLRPLKKLGDWSYALYLWHWPILVIYLEMSGHDAATPRGGLYVLAASLALAAITTWIVEDRFTSLPRFTSSRAWSLGIAATALIPLVGAATVAGSIWADRQREVEAATALDAEHPGAAVLAEDFTGQVPEADFIPSLELSQDLPRHYVLGCDAGLDGPDAIVCEYGDPDSERTLAIVGGSRIAHLIPAMEQAALEHGWGLVAITKSACQYSTDPEPLNTDKTLNESCLDWNADVEELLPELKPDLVVTLATRALGAGEATYPEFADRWRELDELGIDVLAVRDLPRLGWQLPDCVEQNGLDECVTPESQSHDETNPALEQQGVPDNVAFADLTPYVCPDAQCPPVIGNVLTYRDNSHLTATYSASLGPFAAEAVLEATGW